MTYVAMWILFRGKKSEASSSFVYNRNVKFSLSSDTFHLDHCTKAFFAITSCLVLYYFMFICILLFEASSEAVL